MMRMLLNYVLIFLPLVVGAQTFTQAAYPTLSQPIGSDVAWSQTDQATYLASTNLNGLVVVIKSDLTGSVLWSRDYNLPGGSAVDIPEVETASGGTVYIGGMFDGDSTANVGYYILALNPLGAVLWTRTYATSTLYSYSHPRLTIFPDSSLMITESVWGHMGYIKFDQTGNVTSSLTYRDDTTATYKSPGFDSDVFPDESMVFVGKSDSDIVVINTNASGTVNWQYSYNGGGHYYQPRCVAALNDGTCVLAGIRDTNAFITRINAGGVVLWYHEYDSQNHLASFNDIVQLDSVTLAVFGDFGGATLAKFDINGNLLNALQAGDTDNVIVCERLEINSNGALMWPSHYYNLPSFTHGHSIMVMDDILQYGCLLSPTVLTLYTSSGLLIVPSAMYVMPQVISQTSGTTVSSSYPATFSPMCSLVGLTETEQPKPIFTLLGNPTPAGSSLVFQLQYCTGSTQYSICNAAGVEVLVGKFYNNEQEVVLQETGNLASGVYLIRFTNGNQAGAAKFVFY